MDTKSGNELAVLWTTQFIAWAKGRGVMEEGRLFEALLKWRDSVPDGTLWEILEGQIHDRAKKEGITAEDFVKRLFGDQSTEKVMAYFRGSQF